MNDGEKPDGSNPTQRKTIPFGDLHQADSISVQTERSNYQFSLLSSSDRKGILKGGALGDQTREAILVGALSDGAAVLDTTGLKTGCRAVFLIEATRGAGRIITSTVIRLSHTRGTADGECVA